VLRAGSPAAWNRLKGHMNARYGNPWYDGKTDPTAALYGGPEFYEATGKAEEHAGCFIYFRAEFGEPRFDVVVDDVCVARRATLTGARMAAESKPWKSMDWWKKRRAA